MRTAIAILALSMIATSAWAKPAPGRGSASKPATKKVKTLTFDRGSELEGGVDSPGGDQIYVAPTLSHTNLIRVRTDFLPEIYRSAEDL